jgi:hypothetical protein
MSREERLSQEEPKEPDTDSAEERAVRQSLLSYYSSKVSDHGIYLLTLALITASIVGLPITRTLQVPLLSAIVTVAAYELYRLLLCGMLAQAILSARPLSSKEIGAIHPLTYRMNEGAVIFVKTYPVTKNNPQTWPLAFAKLIYRNNWGLVIYCIAIFLLALFLFPMALK